jgi:hypothetical protein
MLLYTNSVLVFKMCKNRLIIQNNEYCLNSCLINYADHLLLLGLRYQRGRDGLIGWTIRKGDAWDAYIILVENLLPNDHSQAMKIP